MNSFFFSIIFYILAADFFEFFVKMAFRADSHLFFVDVPGVIGADLHDHHLVIFEV